MWLVMKIKINNYSNLLTAWKMITNKNRIKNLKNDLNI